VGTLQSSLSGYFLAVFEDNDVYAAGLHETASADAQLWSYDESTGLIIARGMEYALTADAALDVQLRDKVEESDDDESAQRWVITITNHIVCLRNGKSVTFSSPKEGMPVRLMATSEKNRNQQWIFGATPAPTLSPTRPPSFHKKKKHKQPNKSSSTSSVWFWLKATFSLGSLAACGGLSVWIWRKVEAAAGGGSSEPEKDDDDNGGPENRKKKKRPVKPSNSSGVPNPFESSDVEMAQFPSNEGEDDDEDNDDTVPLVERRGDATTPDDASGKQRGELSLPFVFNSLDKTENQKIIFTC
jgi:hypothetical protein